MIPPLARAILTTLRANVPGLAGVHDGQEPLNDWRTPLVVLASLDWETERTLGASMERAEIRIRVTDEVSTTHSTVADIAARIDEVLTGRDVAVPALDAVVGADAHPILDGWHIENIERLGSKSHTQALDGHRYAHTVLDYEILCESVR